MMSSCDYDVFDDDVGYYLGSVEGNYDGDYDDVCFEYTGEGTLWQTYESRETLYYSMLERGARLECHPMNRIVSLLGVEY